MKKSSGYDGEERRFTNIVRKAVVNGVIKKKRRDARVVVSEVRNAGV